MQNNLQNLLVKKNGVNSSEVFQSFLDKLPVRSPTDLVLINPQLVPEENFDVLVARNKGYYAYPPVGLLYLAATAKKVNPSIDIKIIDLNYELLRHAHDEEFSYKHWQEIVSRTIEQCKEAHVGITYMFSATKSCFVDVARYVRENYPKIPLLAGGVQATYDYKEILKEGHADIVFRKEAELQFKSFMESCFSGKVISVPNGIAISLEDKVYELGENTEEVPIDEDIREFYSLIPVENYHRYGSLAAFSRYNGEDKSFATVLSNRGCRARCTFCTVRDFNGFGVRQRSVRSVIDEIKFLVKEKGIKQIDWLDDDLLWNPSRAVELFNGLSTEVPEIEWICNNGLIAAAITDEIMYSMVKSGMKAFKIGIESGNDKILKDIKKPTTKPKLREKSELFKRYPEVFVSANFIVGFPNETFAQMMDTYNFANELKWDWSSFYICQPLKGTEMFSAFQALGDERVDVDSYDRTLNPGKAAARGEFGYQFDKNREQIRTGKDVFNIPEDSVPSQEQIKEIWFTFNLMTNFFQNYNFTSDGRVDKMIRWFDSIYQAYPYDASMCAALVRGYTISGDNKNAGFYKRRFYQLLDESAYWRRRAEEFPELISFAEGKKLEELIVA